MKKEIKEEQWQLETHQGNEWRALTMLIDRLKISDVEKKELEDLAYCFGEARNALAIFQEKAKWAKEIEKILKISQKIIKNENNKMDIVFKAGKIYDPCSKTLAQQIEAIIYYYLSEK